MIYDLKINKAFSLNETCAMVWAECDGEKSIAEIASILSRRTKGLVNEEVVWLALETLQRENLLTNKDGVQSNFSGLNRRQVIRKVGFATMVVIPAIISLVAPTALNAASTAGCAFPGGQPSGFPFPILTSATSCNICPSICASSANGTLNVRYRPCCSGRSTVASCIFDRAFRNANCGCVCV